MRWDSSTLDIAFDISAVHARTDVDLAYALSLAEQRVAEARKAQAEAEQARQELEAALAAAERASEALWKEKQALANENEVLLNRLATLVAQLAAATSRDLQLELSNEIGKLQRQLDERNRTLFGTRSERRPKPEDEQKSTAKKRRRKRSGGKRRAQPALPVQHVHHQIAPEDLHQGCQACHGDLVEMAGQTEDSELIDIQPIRYMLHVHRCQKYRCRSCGNIMTSPGTDKLVPGGRYSPALATQVAVDKFVDHLPLARQVRRMKRRGVEITTQALCDQLERMYLLLLPTELALRERILQAELVHVDETPWRMMSNEGGSTRWWCWGLSDGQAVCYQIVQSRGNGAARALLGDYAGIVMADDFVVYRSLQGERTRLGGVQQVIGPDGEVVDLPTPDYTLATCWMHARRYLYKAEAYHPEAGVALDLIAELYAVEDAVDRQVQKRVRCHDGPVDDASTHAWLLEARRHLRDERSRRIIDRLDQWRRSVRSLDGSALAEALAHLERIWPRLVLFLDDPRIPLDNGEIERQIRGPVQGRKNYQGSRSEVGARVAALHFGLLATARNMGLDPFEYLHTALLEAIRRPGAVHTPWDHAERIAKAAGQT